MRLVGLSLAAGLLFAGQAHADPLGLFGEACMQRNGDVFALQASLEGTGWQAAEVETDSGVAILYSRSEGETTYRVQIEYAQGVVRRARCMIIADEDFEDIANQLTGALGFQPQLSEEASAGWLFSLSDTRTPVAYPAEGTVDALTALVVQTGGLHEIQLMMNDQSQRVVVYTLLLPLP